MEAIKEIKVVNPNTITVRRSCACLTAKMEGDTLVLECVPLDEPGGPHYGHCPCYPCEVGEPCFVIKATERE